MWPSRDDPTSCPCGLSTSAAGAMPRSLSSRLLNRTVRVSPWARFTRKKSTSATEPLEPFNVSDEAAKAAAAARVPFGSPAAVGTARSSSGSRRHRFRDVERRTRGAAVGHRTILIGRLGGVSKGEATEDVYRDPG